jgi:hypothetical protein
MRLSLFLLLFISIQSVTFAAEYHLSIVPFQDTPETIIQKEILSNGNISYMLTSNKLLLAQRIDIWESRFLVTFSEIISIELNHLDQSIHLILSADHSAEYLNSILKIFEVLNYSINMQ